MSHIFYDRLIVFEEVEAEIKKVAKTPEEKEELWREVDEIVHHRVMGCILDRLPREHHQEFLERFHKAPYDEGLIPFLTERIGEDTEEFIKIETENLKKEILAEIKRIF